MDVDPVRLSAQATVDAIDQQIRELSAARESVVRLFGLGVRTGTAEQIPVSPPAPVAAPPPPPPQSVRVESPPDEDDSEDDICDCEISHRQQQRLNWDMLRQRSLMILNEHGSMDLHSLRLMTGMASRQVKPVMDHQWFERSGKTFGLTPEGMREAHRRTERVGT